MTQNPHLSGGNQAKVRVDLFYEPLAPLGNLVDPIRSEIRIPWREIISQLIFFKMIALFKFTATVRLTLIQPTFL